MNVRQYPRATKYVIETFHSSSEKRSDQPAPFAGREAFLPPQLCVNLKSRYGGQFPPGPLLAGSAQMRPLTAPAYGRLRVKRLVRVPLEQ
jgi:hypothetical protein